MQTEKNGEVLKITGDCLIEHATDLRNLLLQSMQEHDSLTLELSQMGKADLSFLQLMCAAQKTFVKNNKELNITTEKPDMLKELAQESGFMDVCRVCSMKSCFFQGG